MNHYWKRTGKPRLRLPLKCLLAICAGFSSDLRASENPAEAAREQPTEQLTGQPAAPENGATPWTGRINGAARNGTAGADTADASSIAERNAYFGDLHVHTGYSFDAFLFSAPTTPDDAYRFAKGGTVEHLAGFDMTLKEPLDFYAVTDHAFLMGAMPAMKDPAHPLSGHPDAKALTSLTTREDRIKAFRLAVQFLRPDSPRYREIDDPTTTRGTWADIVAAANRHYDPGRFTTFIGYEWSSAPAQQNLHRNVIFQGGEAPIALTRGSFHRTRRISGRGWTFSGNRGWSPSRYRTIPTAPTARCSAGLISKAIPLTPITPKSAFATNPSLKSPRSRHIGNTSGIVAQ